MPYNETVKCLVDGGKLSGMHNWCARCQKSYTNQIALSKDTLTIEKRGKIRYNYPIAKRVRIYERVGRKLVEVL